MRSAPAASQIVAYGLWSGNAGLVQLLGLCPLLAVSNSAVNALGMGLATMLALTCTSAAIALLHTLTRREIRIPAFVMIIAAIVTSIELAMHAWLPNLHHVLGLFLPLIVTNCAILGRAEAFASRTDPFRAALDGFAVGAGFLLVLLVLGGSRELLGQGSLFAGAGRLLGLPAMEIEVAGYRGFLLAVLPPGAFILLASMIALKQFVQRPRAHSAAAPTAQNHT
ncbi:MAG: electron transport complex subunit E [Pseudomarimonas sp.]